jgi:hypothetical protein
MSQRKSDLGIPLPYTWLNPSTRPSTLQRNTKAIPNYTTIAFIGGITASVKVKETPEQIANVKQLHGKERQ